MYEDDDIEVTANAKELTSDQTKWVKANLAGGKDFSIVMAVGRDKQPTVWTYRADGTTTSNTQKVMVESAPDLGDRCLQLLSGEGSHCVVYKIGGKRIVVCW